MRRIVPLLAAMATLIAVALPSIPASASTTHAAKPAATGITTVRILPSGARLVEIPASIVDCTNSTPCNLCLTNSNTHCAAFNPMDIVQAVLDSVDSAIVIWEWIRAFLGDGGTVEEPKSDGSDGGGTNDAGLCLQATDSYVSFATCGSNGTYWVQIAHNNGSYLENRYEHDHGITKYLTVADNVNGKRLYDGVADSGAWQNWTWSNCLCQ